VERGSPASINRMFHRRMYGPLKPWDTKSKLPPPACAAGLAGAARVQLRAAGHRCLCRGRSRLCSVV